MKSHWMELKLDGDAAQSKLNWTVFSGAEWIEAGELRAHGPTFRAIYNGRIDPGRLRLVYEASMPAEAVAGTFSDLSCHVGSVRFQFGARLNTVTGIAGPGRAIPAVDPPRIVPGTTHRVEIEIEECSCRMRVDGKDAGSLQLDAPPGEASLELYAWAGAGEFRNVRLFTPGGRAPVLLRDAPWIREKERLRNLGQSIVWIEHRGKFLHECGLEGEGRDLGVYPAHPNGIQLSHDRFLLLYSTRAYRGDDDEKSGIYQIRAGGFDGPVLREGWICRTCDDWDAIGDGRHCVRQHGHPVAFGVPLGARIRGRRVAHENVFGVIWRREARRIDPQTGFMAYVEEHPELTWRTRSTEWLQFRLNARGDDIEILQAPQMLRQAGYAEGDSFCRHEEARCMTANFVQPLPYNDDASEWVHADTIYFPGEAAPTDPRASVMVHGCGAVVPLRFQFQPACGLYQWVETGPPLGGRGQGLFEGSLLPYRGEWLLVARRKQADAVAWGRTGDLFGRRIDLQLATDQPNGVPTSAYLGPDGVVRRTGGLPRVSPYGLGRDPLYLMDLDPDHGLRMSNPRVIFDARQAGVPIPCDPIADFGKLLPHTGGSCQWVLHRVRSPLLNDPAKPHQKLTRMEVEASGIYAAKIHYREPHPGSWEF